MVCKGIRYSNLTQPDISIPGHDKSISNVRKME